MEIGLKNSTIVEEKRNSIKLWNDKYHEKEKQYISQINSLLEKHTSESYNEICDMFYDSMEKMTDDEIISLGKIPINLFKTRNELSYIIQAVNIYFIEKEAGINITIFDHGTSVDDIIDVINQVRFIFWELEFLNSADLLTTYVQEKNISQYMLAYLVKCSTINGYKMALKLADIFNKNKMFKYELQMLIAACDIKDGDEIALKRLAELYRKVERKDLANRCMSQIKLNNDAVFEQKEKNINFKNRNLIRHRGKKIAFILCVNNSVYVQEALYFINNLEIPEGCEIDVLTIEQAKSMTSGYNEGMNATNAKYKIYLHQDVMILNRYFIYDILDIFENPQIGMIGMVGAPNLSESKVMWYSERVGKIYTANAYEMQLWNLGDVMDKYEKVEVVDGLLIATQYDIPWREDLLEKWDMYDVSQSLEFHKAGYDVVVPHMETPWCLHDDGFMNLEFYYEERDKIFNEYF